MKVTKFDIANWIGSDNLKVDDLLRLLAELANGDYTPEQFRSDVIDLIEQE